MIKLRIVTPTEHGSRTYDGDMIEPLQRHKDFAGIVATPIMAGDPFGTSGLIAARPRLPGDPRSVHIERAPASLERAFAEQHYRSAIEMIAGKMTRQEDGDSNHADIGQWDRSKWAEMRYAWQRGRL
jgi:hypothetical protein